LMNLNAQILPDDHWFDQGAALTVKRPLVAHAQILAKMIYFS
jgi:hypothetical protein